MMKSVPSSGPACWGWTVHTILRRRIIILAVRAGSVSFDFVAPQAQINFATGVGCMCCDPKVKPLSLTLLPHLRSGRRKFDFFPFPPLIFYTLTNYYQQRPKTEKGPLNREHVWL